MSGLETVVLRSMGDLEAIASEWQELLARSVEPEIFRSYDWLKTWWDVFGTGERELLVITVRHGRTLVGIAPLVVHDRRRLGLARVRRLEFMGTGEDEADEVCSDFMDVIAAPAYQELVCREVWRQLIDERPAWDELGFRNVLEGSLLFRYLKPLSRDSGCRFDERPAGERFHVDLSSGDFNAYVEGLSKKRKKRIFYYRRRMEKEGEIVGRSLERKDEIPFFLREIARLNRLRRGLQGMPSAFESARFRQFHELAAGRLWDKGCLDLRLWVKEGRTVAALYNFLYGGTIYYYQSGFDTEAFGNISPGLVTLTQVIEWGFAQGHRRFDFLVGAEGSYKEDYGCLTESAHDLTIYNNTVTGQMLRSVRKVRGILREVRTRQEAAHAARTGPAIGSPVPVDGGDAPDPEAA